MAILPRTGDACTSFCLSQDGAVMVGNNDDWFSVSAYLVVNKRGVTKQAFVPTEDPPLRWTSKYGSVTVDYNAIGIPSAGMNEAGLVIDELFPGALNIEYEPKDERPEIDEVLWIQYQLDTCATVEEVLQTRDSVRIVPYYWHSHYFVCDRTGAAAAIGFAQGKMVVHRLPPASVQCLANRPYPRDLAALQNADTDNATPHKPGSSPARFQAAAERTGQAELSQIQKPHHEYAFDVLKAASTHATAISWVYDPVGQKIHYQTNRDGKRRSVDLTQFDYRSETPMLVVDVNHEQAGDITSAFEPYRPEVNQKLVWQTIKDWRKHGFALHIKDADVER
ncbi:MAG: linear amide C-N hydrolase, partial [Planctomycetota bacterium]